MKWTQEQDDELRQLHANKSLSMSNIARKMGVTRNAVIGRSHRLGFTKRQTGFSMQEKRHVTKRPKPKRMVKRMTNHGNRFYAVEICAPMPMPVLEGPSPEALARRAQLFDLKTNECLWPHGDPGTPDFFFCAGPKVEGLPYCARHCQISYRTPAEAKRESAAKAA